MKVRCPSRALLELVSESLERWVGVALVDTARAAKGLQANQALRCSTEEHNGVTLQHAPLASTEYAGMPLWRSRHVTKLRLMTAMSTRGIEFTADNEAMEVGLTSMYVSNTFLRIDDIFQRSGTP